MSHFASALNELIEKKEVNQAELGRRTGITQPNISRWINAEQVWISDEDFQRLCKFFTKPTEQVSLIRGRILDMLAGTRCPSSKLIKIEVLGEESTPDAHQTYQHKLPPKQDKDIQTIIENMNDKLVRDMISSLATHLRRKP